jgi:hypothetical protein
LLCSGDFTEPSADAYADTFFHLTENSSATVAGNIAPIVHTQAAFCRLLKELPHKEAA